jgi:hypothetical protein
MVLTKTGVTGPTYPGGTIPSWLPTGRIPSSKSTTGAYFGSGEAAQGGDVAAYKETFINATGHYDQ